MTTPRAWDRPFFKAAENKPEVIAHRGGAAQWPGETVFAFEQALALMLVHNPTVEEILCTTGCTRRSPGW